MKVVASALAVLVRLSFATVDTLSHDSLSSLMTHGTPYDFILIDLRGPSDVGFTQVVGNAQCHPYNLTWPDTFKTNCTRIGLSQHVIVYCQTGGRAGLAVHYLDSLHYLHVHMGGGFGSGALGSWTGGMLPKSQALPSDSLPKPSMTASTSVRFASVLPGYTPEPTSRLSIGSSFFPQVVSNDLQLSISGRVVRQRAGERR